MKIVAIGDIDGKDCWKRIDPKGYDKIVFVGDYGFLLVIIQLKKKHSEKVEILLGNHNMHYLLYGFIEPYSGFNVQSYRKFREVCLENKRLFNVAYQHENYLFSHAGLSNQWWNWINRDGRIGAMFENCANISDGLNLLHRNRDLYKVLHSVGASRGGREIGGLLWADISDTKEDQLKGFHQVVGHSKVNKITNHKSGVDTSITYKDILDSNKEFFELEI